VFGPHTGHARNPFVHNPNINPYAGKSDIVHSTIPLNLNDGHSICISAEASTTSIPSHSSRNSSTKGLRKMSIFFDVGDSFPDINKLRETKNFFVTSHGGKLYNKTITGQVL
jgi:hypothetical protein